MNPDREPTGDASNTRSVAVKVQWLVRLRWAAIAAQVASIAGVKYLLRAPFPLAPLVTIIGALVVANVVLGRTLARGVRLGERAIAGNLLLDIAALTGVLIWTGGAMNPFTTLYLLQVVLAAVLDTRRWSVLVTIAATLAFGGLLLARPEAVHVWHSPAMFMLHVRGMWLAFALTAGCLWFFVDRVSTALRLRENELARARIDAERGQRLAAIGALAAGTAHELNTPLGTVAILAAELSERLAGDPKARALADEIRREVKRCSSILARMRGGETSLEAPRPLAIGAWTERVVTEWRERNARETVVVRIDPAVESAIVALRPEALARALHSLLDNARLAQRASAPIEVSVAEGSGSSIDIAVTDHGTGLTAEQIARIGEPFFTTRAPGDGLGLGLFLAELTVQELGGALVVASGDGVTRVALRVPRRAPDAAKRTSANDRPARTPALLRDA